MKTRKSIPRDHRHHFMKCECGEYFDMRDLKDVMNHLHKSSALSNTTEYSHSITIGEPIVYTRSKNEINLN
jgi:hypothetical protein